MFPIMHSIIIGIEIFVNLFIRIIYTIFYLVQKPIKIINKSSILYASIRFNYNNVTEFMLYMGTDPDVPHPAFPSGTHVTPLIYSADYNNVEAAKLLIRYGADVNKSISELGITPLYAAVVYKNIDCINVLLDNGANINLVTDRHTTPIEWALIMCYGDINTLDRQEDESTIIHLTETSFANVIILQMLVSYFLLHDAYKMDRTSYGYIRNKRIIQRSVLLQRLKRYCIEDIKIMKNIIIGRIVKTSFFDLFMTGNVAALSKHLKNKDILQLPSSLKVYDKKVEAFIDKSIKRRDLIYEVDELISNVFHWKRIPREIRYMILDYMDVDDLSVTAGKY